MIYFDTTKAGRARHRSGLVRSSSRLREELGSAVTEVAWDGGRRTFVTTPGGVPAPFRPADWLLTVELFCEEERPGIREFVARPPCRLAALYHDAIPLRWPHITWPQSVRRHPDYMKLLASFDRTWGNSQDTVRDFAEFWRWQGVEPRARSEALVLGADFDGSRRVQRDPVVPPGRPAVLCVGIIEPRKNQDFLLGVAEALWRDGLDFELHVVGRLNPHFGPPMAARMKALQQREPRFHHHGVVGDRELGRLYGVARAVAFPTIAEGCGLPLLESLWRGVPCVASDLPALRENAADGGCLLAGVNDAADWAAKLHTVLTAPAECLRLQREAMARPLPRWGQTARILLEALR